MELEEPRMREEKIKKLQKMRENGSRKLTR